MQLDLLNLLIEGERLKSLLTIDRLDELSEHALIWRADVESIVLALEKPLTDENHRAVGALMETVDALQEGLVSLRAHIFHEQQQLLKGNAAVHAYVSSGA